MFFLTEENAMHNRKLDSFITVVNGEKSSTVPDIATQELNKEIQRLKNENANLIRENKELHNLAQQRETDEAILPPHVRKSLQKTFEEKVAVARNLQAVNTVIEKEAREQAGQIIARAYISRQMQKKLAELQFNQQAVKKSMLQERKSFDNAQTKLQQNLLGIINKSAAIKSMKEREEADKKMKGLLEEKQKDNIQYTAALKPLHNETIQWLTRWRREGVQGFLKWRKMDKKIKNAANDLSELLDQKIKLEEQLEIKPAFKKENKLTIFGGVPAKRVPLNKEEQQQFDKLFLDTVNKANFSIKEAENLLKAGANIDAVNPESDQTTLAAVLNSEKPDVHIIRWLIQRGANPNQLIELRSGKNKCPCPPLTFILKKWNLDHVVQGLTNLLLASKADINKPDMNGDTALHWAAYQNKLETTSYLCDKGANRTLLNKHGRTALEEGFAENKVLKPEIQALLEKANEQKITPKTVGHFPW